MPLAARGAASTASPRVAQAVAVRVLNDHGVRVRSWHGADSADQPTYRAELEALPELGPRSDREPSWTTVVFSSTCAGPR
jgi:hypothetical protein